jgi:hypothetical protein
VIVGPGCEADTVTPVETTWTESYFREEADTSRVCFSDSTAEFEFAHSTPMSYAFSLEDDQVHLTNSGITHTLDYCLVDDSLELVTFDFLNISDLPCHIAPSPIGQNNVDTFSVRVSGTWVFVKDI